MDGFRGLTMTLDSIINLFLVFEDIIVFDGNVDIPCSTNSSACKGISLYKSSSALPLLLFILS